MNKIKHLALLSAMSVLSLPLLAQTAGSAPSGQPPGPPPEAIAACNGKAEGAQVQFTNRSGAQLSGTCQKIGNVLAARPAGGPGGPPPPSK